MEFQAFANGVLGHGRMGAEGDHHVHRAALRGNETVEGFKYGTDGRGAGGIGDDEENAFVLPVVARAGCGDGVFDRGGGEALAGWRDL